MKKLIAILIAVCIYLSLFSVSCFDPGFVLIGEWEEESEFSDTDGDKYDRIRTLNFKENDRFTFNIERIYLNSSFSQYNTSTSLQGDWEATEDTLTLNYDDGDIVDGIYSLDGDTLIFGIIEYTKK